MVLLVVLFLFMGIDCKKEASGMVFNLVVG
jgi:hypothetical protein